jgi:hypothetical protein
VSETCSCDMGLIMQRWKEGQDVDLAEVCL